MSESDKILLNKLEELNTEYLNSNYYSFGKYMRTIFSLLKKGKFINVVQLYVLHIKNKKKKKENVNIEVQCAKSSQSYCVDNNSNIKIAVYTCITGKYDAVEEPLITESNCDYFLFTNNSKLQSVNWKIKSIPEHILDFKDNAKINRYIKMHPAELFPEYDYTIYIDGNIKLISTISNFVERINSTTGLAIHKHCANNCIYDEYKTCRAYGKGDNKNLKKQIKMYEKEGFPHQYGLLECNVLVYDIKNKKSKSIFDDWWNEYLNSESMRDQIALPFVLWKNNVKLEDIGILGDNVNKNPSLKINNHI